MTIDKILEKIEVLDTLGVCNREITSVAYHSKKVNPGCLFVCIRGYKTDGHQYLKQAVDGGAIAAIVEVFQPGIAIPQFLVADSRKALALAGAAFYGNPSDKMKMIGITATNGKTTTSFMVNSIFEELGYKTGLIGTVMIKNDKSSIASDLTTPESLDLQQYLGEMADGGVSHVTMEVSSSALELNRVYGIQYDIVAFNNLSREHIDMHGSFEQYYEAKSSLIKNASANSIAVLNIECAYSSDLKANTAARVIQYGVDNEAADVVCKNLDLSSGRAKFTVVIPNAFDGLNGRCDVTSFEVALAVPGLHSVYNALSAIAIALAAGAPVDAIQKGLLNFKGVERRFEFIYEDDFIIIDDHFANAGNIDVTLNTLDFMNYECLNLVYAIRGNRGPIVNRENAQAIAKWSKILGFNRLIATKSIDFTTEKDIVTDEETSVFLEVMKANDIAVHMEDTLAKAVEKALSEVEKGDLILLAGCQGMDFGADVALRQLMTKYPEKSKDVLLAPLKYRVCGITTPIE